jgi:octanoyl-[GcvH]:protein N-octanoyltransferase
MRLSPLMRRVADAIAPGLPIEIGGGASAVDRDEVLLGQCLQSPSRDRLVRLWVNAPCLVTTRRLSRRVEFDQASAISAGCGWPVYVRASGGTTVAHRNGILNVSLLTNAPIRTADVRQAFAPLVDCISVALASLGLPVTTGFSAGSYCDGAYNLLANGSKIRRAANTLAQLAHATISVEGDVAQDVAAVARFEAALGLVPAYSVSAHSTVKGSLAAR